MLKVQKKTAFMQVPRTHVDVFVEYYDVLKQWALRFAKHDRELAEDLLHDAFIHFTLTKPDLDSIESLENYLYIVMRNLHLSQLRKATRNPVRTLSIVEYDTVDLGVWASDPRDELRLRADLSAVCQYACIRKETSKIGSILILRFFHGYYPEEIAEVMRVSRPQVDNGLRDSRLEARAYLEDPNSISFIGDQNVKTKVEKVELLDADLRLALRKQIFSARQHDCTPKDQLNNLYEPDSRSLGTRVLAHSVSCGDCLENINSLLGLPPLASRYPVDTIGKDPGPKDKTGGSDGSGGGGAGGSNMLDSYVKFRDLYYHHQPEELSISVNGLFQGAHKVAANRNEMRLKLDTTEPLGFVEVFSEQGLRLLMLNVEPPPTGEGDQSICVELSSGRTLEANLTFSGESPALQVTYNDPLFVAEALVETTEVPQSSSSAAEIFSTPLLDRRGADASSAGWLKKLGGGFEFWLQPARLTSAFAALLIAALLIYQFAPTTVSAAELLNRSAEQEIAQLANKERVLHRTLDLEEYKNGQLASRKKIDVWHSAELGVTARRLYDEQGRLVTGDWRDASGIQTIYQKGTAAKLQPVPEKRGTAVLFEDAWHLSLSAKEFNALVNKPEETQLEERDNEYVISYDSPPYEGGVAEGRGGSLVKAQITLSKEDLHAIEQSFTLNISGETREYRMTEAAYEWRPANAVAPAVFEPNVELTGNTPGSPPSKGGVDAVSADGVVVSDTNTNSNTNTATPATLATAALEVEVIDLLNSAGAFMGEQIDVSRTADGKITVNALVETDKRKAELTNALASVRNNPAIRIRIETVAEAQAREARNRKGNNPQNVIIDSFEATENTSPVYNDLRKKFDEAGARSYADRILRRSSQARRHALAAKQLSDRFSQTDLASLIPAERAKWIGLVTGHANKFLAEFGTLQRDLESVFPDLAGGGSGRSVATDKEIQAAVRELYNLSLSVDEDLRGSFALMTSGGGSAQVKTAKFWRSLNNATAIARSLQSAK